MKKLFWILSGLIFFQCTGESASSLQSPDGKIIVNIELGDTGEALYSVNFDGSPILKPSKLGFDFLDQKSISGNLEIESVTVNSISETWEMPWGEQRFVENSYNEMIVELQEKVEPARKFSIIFRAYNDGIGFRYEFPVQEAMDSVFITDENTEFILDGDHMVYWIPGDWDIYEHLYNTCKFSEINAIKLQNHKNLAQTYIPENAVNTPVTMKTNEGIYLSFHEANLTNYSGMTLQVDTSNYSMKSNLVGSARTDYKVKRALPFKTPFRSVQISENASGLIDSKLIVNLNEPNKLEDISWFTPMKYVGIWWEMHLGLSSWDYKEPSAKYEVPHGATTENAKKYIDFAAENGIKGLLVEGWYTGWDHWIGFEDREGVFDFVTEYPDYDIEEVVRYANEKGVQLIMHHETSAAPRTYEEQLDTAYNLMESLGIHAVKTGYVGKIIPVGEYHHGQWMVNHYRKVLEHAAEHKVAVNAHEPIKATGLRRTYPNAIAREGLRGQEFNAWAMDGGNPPEHLSVVAFTRMLAGPIDFTPGVFELGLKPKPDNQINTTLAHQLALYVVIYSPVQMACDLPENYEGHPAFQFIRDVGVNWEQSITLDGEPGDFVTIVREERDSGNWFLGSITDENAREITINFGFLPEEIEFQTSIYSDGKNAHYKDNPGDYLINQELISKGDKRSYKLAPGGGLAISLIKK